MCRKLSIFLFFFALSGYSVADDSKYLEVEPGYYIPPENCIVDNNVGKQLQWHEIAIIIGAILGSGDAWLKVADIAAAWIESLDYLKMEGVSSTGRCNILYI